jgi:NADH:ubiquinone oxidoreductase subunit 2 (subunit N)
MLVSGIKGMYWLGILMFIGSVVTVIFYIKNVTSVWCFFAAIISVGIYRVIRQDPRPG